MSWDKICQGLIDYIAFSCSEKRGIDFGLGRGYSGSQVRLHFDPPSDNLVFGFFASQAAKHMLGLHQASYAGGPGKR